MTDSPTNLPDTSSRPQLHRKGLLREVFQTLLFLVAVYVLLEMTIPRSVVLSISMEPNLIADQRLLISRMSYLFGEPERGDIVVFMPPNQPAGEPPLIKRLIGLPGETVSIRDTYLYVNGVQLEEDYLKEPCDPFRCPDQSWQLGAEEFFFMGDNRNHSHDSRAFGPIQRGQIVGKAVLRWWPPAKWGILSYNYHDPAQ
jgi:signal peptidase I